MTISSRKLQSTLALTSLFLLAAVRVQGGTSTGNPRWIPFKADTIDIEGVRPNTWKESDLGEFVTLSDVLRPEGEEPSYVRFLEWKYSWVRNKQELKAELQRWKQCEWREVQLGRRVGYVCGTDLKGIMGVLREPGRVLYLEYSTPSQQTLEQGLRPVLHSVTFKK